MKKITSVLLALFLAASVAGCNGKVVGGAAGGVVGAGAGYEYRARQELKRIEEAYKSGAMTEEEYLIRKDQIQRMSVLQ